MKENVASNSSGVRIIGIHVMAYIINYIASCIINIKSATYLLAISTICLYSSIYLLGNTPLQTLSILIANPFFTVTLLMAFSFAINLLFEYLRNHYTSNSFPRPLYKPKRKNEHIPIIILFLVINILIILRFSYALAFKIFNIVAAFISLKVIIYSLPLTSLILFLHPDRPHLRDAPSIIMHIITSLIILFIFATATVIMPPMVISLLYLIAILTAFSVTENIAYDIKKQKSRNNDLTFQLYSIALMTIITEISIISFNLLTGSIILAITPYSPYIIASIGCISLSTMIYRNNRSMPETLVGSMAYSLLAYFSITKNLASFPIAPQISILLLSIGIGLISAIIISKIVNKITARNAQVKNSNNEFAKMIRKECHIDKIEKIENHIKPIFNNILNIIIYPIHVTITSINIMMFDIINGKSNGYAITSEILSYSIATYYLLKKTNTIHYIMLTGPTPVVIAANTLTIISCLLVLFLANNILMFCLKLWHEETDYICITSNRRRLKEHTFNKFIDVSRKVLCNILKIAGLIIYYIIAILLCASSLILLPIVAIFPNLNLGFEFNENTVNRIINTIEEKLKPLYSFILVDSSRHTNPEDFLEREGKRAKNDFMFQLNILIQTFLTASITVIAGAAAFITMMPAIINNFALYTPYILIILATISLLTILRNIKDEELYFVALCMALSCYLITKSTIAFALSPYIVGIIFATVYGVFTSIVFFMICTLIKNRFIKFFNAIPESVQNNILYVLPFLITLLYTDKQKSKIKENEDLITHASNDTIIELAKEDEKALTHALENITDNKEIMLEIIKCNSKCLQHASQRLQEDEEVVLEAVQQDPTLFKNIHEKLRGNKDIALSAISKIGSLLSYARTDLQEDKEVVLSAIKQDATLFENIYKKLRNDKDIVMAAVTQNGKALEFASPSLQGDKEAVMAAIEQNSMALEFASEELKNDKDVVMAAIEQNGEALVYASAALQGNKDIVWRAITSNNSFIFKITHYEEYYEAEQKTKKKFGITITYNRKTVNTSFEEEKDDMKNLIRDLRPNCQKFIENKISQSKAHEKKDNDGIIHKIQPKYPRILIESIIANRLFQRTGLYMSIITLIQYLKNERQKDLFIDYHCTEECRDKDTRSITTKIPEECMNKVLEFIIPRYNSYEYNAIDTSGVDNYILNNPEVYGRP